MFGRIRDRRVNVDFEARGTAEVLSEADAVEQAADALDGRDIDMRLDFDSGGSVAQMAATQGAMVGLTGASEGLIGSLKSSASTLRASGLIGTVGLVGVGLAAAAAGAAPAVAGIGAVGVAAASAGVGVGLLAGAAVPLVMGLTKITEANKKVTTATDAQKVAQGELKAALASGNEDRIASARSALATATRNVSEAQKAAKITASGYSDSVVKLQKRGQGFATSFTDAMGPASNSLAKFGLKLLNVGEKAFPALGKEAKENAGAIRGAFDSLSRKLGGKEKNSLLAILDSSSDTLGSLFRSAGKFGGALANAAKEALPVVKDLTGWLEDTADAALTFTRENPDAISKWFKNAKPLAKSLAEFVGKAVRLINGFSNEHAGKLVAAIDAINKGLGQIEDIFDLKAPKPKGFVKAGDAAAGDFITSYRKGTVGGGEGKGPMGELGLKIGRALGDSINAGLNGKTGGGKSNADNPIGKWLEKHVPALGWLDKHVADPLWRGFMGAFEGLIRRSEGNKIRKVLGMFFRDEADHGWKLINWDKVITWKYFLKAASNIPVIKVGAKVFGGLVDRAEEASKGVSKQWEKLADKQQKIFSFLLDRAKPTWLKIGETIISNSVKAKEKGGQAQRDLEENTKSIWGKIAAAAKPRWAGIGETIISNLFKAKEKGGESQRDLESNAKNVWSRILSFGKPKWLSIGETVISNLLKAKEKGGESQRDLETNTKNVWERISKSAGPLWLKIAAKVIDPSKSMKDKVVGFWTDLKDFINKVLRAVNLPEISLGGGKGGGGSSGSSGGGGGGPTAGGAGSGGMSKKGEAPHFARGGIFKADRGGVAGPGNMGIVGEAGQREAIVNLERRTPESQQAFREAVKSPNAKGHRRDEGGKGEGLGPTLPDSSLNAAIRERAQKISRATGTSFNTYVGHGKPGGSTQDYTVDFWGKGGRGAPIAKPMGFKTAEMALGQYNSNPPVLYIIRQGEYWRGGNWSGNTYGDPHYDHTHVSWDSPGGAKASGGGSGSGEGFLSSLWDSAGNALWNRLVQPRVDSLVKSLSGGFVLGDAAGAATSNTAAAIKEWIIGESGSSSGGGSGGTSAFKGDWKNAKGGSPSVNMSIGKKAADSLGWGSQWSAWQELGKRESSWNRTAKNSSSGAYGIPQALPESKLPSAGRSSGGSNAGPQIGWMANYMKERYGGPKGALSFHNSHNWYGRGGVIPGPDGEPVLLPAHAGERVLPQDMVRGFDRLAHSVEVWSRRTSTARGPAGMETRSLEHALDKHAARLEKKLEEQLEKMMDPDTLLAMADRYQGSPAGVRRFSKHMKREISGERARSGSR